MTDGEDEPNAGPPARPTPLRPKRESSVIEGDAKGAKPQSEPPPRRGERRSPRGPIGAGAVGGVIGAALTLAGLWFFDLGPGPSALAKRLDLMEARQNAAENDAKASAPRMAALETADASEAVERKTLSDRIAALESEPAAIADIASRVTALEAAEGANATLQKSLAEDLSQLKNASLAAPSGDLVKRITALEAARDVPSGSSPPPADPRVEALVADETHLSDGVAKQAAAAEALAARLDKLEAAAFAAKAETRVAPTEAAASDGPTSRAAAAALAARVDKLEAAAFAAKTQTRVAPTEAPSSPGSAVPTIRAFAALALSARVRAGEPYAVELATLENVGVNPAALAPLKPYAEAGVSTSAALARSFKGIAPNIRPASPPTPASAAVLDRLVGEVQGLVRVRKLGESTIADPVSAPVIEAALAGDDLSGAVAALKNGSTPALGPTSEWLKAAEARLAATKAADALVLEAIADLGAAKR